MAKSIRIRNLELSFRGAGKRNAGKTPGPVSYTHLDVYKRQEFVLYHVDGVEATGFISHLKLPHYVTFQSKLSSVRGTRDEHSECGECDPHGTRVAHDPQSTRDPHDQPAESKEARDAAAL